MSGKLERALRYVVAVALAAAFLGAIDIPAHALIADPNIGTPNELRHTPEPTAAQLNKQMRGTGAAAAVRTTEPETRAAPEEPPSGPEPQAVMAALDVAKSDSNVKAKPKPTQRSSMPLGIAITAGLLGLICVGGMVVVRMGPKPPPLAEPEEDG